MSYGDWSRSMRIGWRLDCASYSPKPFVTHFPLMEVAVASQTFSRQSWSAKGAPSPPKTISTTCLPASSRDAASTSRISAAGAISTALLLGSGGLGAPPPRPPAAAAAARPSPTCDRCSVLVELCERTDGKLRTSCVKSMRAGACAAGRGQTWQARESRTQLRVCRL